MNFLRHLAATGNPAQAARLTGVARTATWRLRSSDKDFRDAWADALEVATDKLEQEARKRALRDSDQLLMFLLKANRPEKYREKTLLEHSGELKGGSQVVVYIPDDGRNPVIEQPAAAELPEPEKPE
jgi:hypothetical protein